MIDLIDVSKSYGPGLPAVNHANLHVDKGEFVFIVGSSGSGKSTLARHINALLVPEEGTMYVDGIDTSEKDMVWEVRKRAGMVFQTLPGSSSVMPICSWQVGSTWLTIILLMLRSFEPSSEPMWATTAFSLVTFLSG